MVQVGDQVKACLSERLLAGDLKDPRLSEGLLTVTGVDMSPDLRQAKVHVSFFASGDSEVDAADVIEGLESAAGLLKRAIADELALRYTPTLLFFHDDSIAYGAKMETLIRAAREDDARVVEDDSDE